MKIHSFSHRVGYLQSKLSKKELNHVNKMIDNKKSRMNNNLAGNISNSYVLPTTDSYFLKNIMAPNIEEYLKNYKDIVPKVLTKDCPFCLDKLWVNFQKKHEFNPPHLHTGVFSFVIWTQIPYDYEKECKLNFIKDSNNKCPGSFSFLHTDFKGQVCTFEYHLSKKDEGTMLFFPANLMHQVFPFYTSDKERISISGNVCLDSTRAIS